LNASFSRWKKHEAADRVENRATVHGHMNRWMREPNLAGIRDDLWLAKLPAGEREQWRKFWSDVRSLRDRTALAKKPAKSTRP
jgi:hypothetical protein